MKKYYLLIPILFLFILAGVFYFINLKPDTSLPKPEDSPPSSSLPPHIFTLYPTNLWENPPEGMTLITIPRLISTASISASGNKVVWSRVNKTLKELKELTAEERKADPVRFGMAVFLYDLETKEEIKIAETTRPEGQIMPVSISGKWIIWVDYTLRPHSHYGSDYIFFAYNIETQEKFILDKGEEKAIIQGAPYPRIHGNRVVWGVGEPTTPQDQKGQRVIKTYDLDTRSISTLAFPNYDLFAPSIHGDNIVYRKKPKDKSWGPGNVYLYNLRTGDERQLSTDGQAYSPVIWGEKVAWLENQDVFLYDLVTGKTQQLTRGEKASLLSIGEVFVNWESGYHHLAFYNLAMEKLELVNKGMPTTTYTTERLLICTWFKEKTYRVPITDTYGISSQGKVEWRVIIYNPPQ